MGVYPSGYTAPSRRPALSKDVVLPDPGSYNRPVVPTAPGAKLHLAMAVPGLRWPSGVKMDSWNDLRGPNEDWQINPNRINTFKELPSANRRVEPDDTPYSQAAAIREVVATTTGGAIEPKKSILDIARSFVLTAIDPAVKDWWARRVNSLDQLEAIAATRSLTASETVIREQILGEITHASNNVNSLAINAPAFQPPAAPPGINDIQRIMVQAFAAHRALEQKGLTPAKPTASPLPPSGAAPAGSAPAPAPASAPIPGKLSGPAPSPGLSPISAPTGTPPLKPLTLHFTQPTTPSSTLGPPPGSPTTTSARGPIVQDYIGQMQSAGPDGTTVIINANATAMKFAGLMKTTYPKGFTKDDAKIWKEPVKSITGLQMVKQLGDTKIAADPVAARDFASMTMTDTNNWRKSAIAMQYCIEQSVYGTHPQLIDYLGDPPKLARVFSESANGRFEFNPNYKAQLV